MRSIGQAPLRHYPTAAMTSKSARFEPAVELISPATARRSTDRRPDFLIHLIPALGSGFPAVV
jgi:hypothetical protein